MGHKTSLEIVESELSLRDQLAWHLQGNHYPPVPLEMVDPCIDSIELACVGDWNAKVLLPEGVSYKGDNYAPVWAMIEQHHLSEWVDDEGEGEY
jgi:hypothetical protein